MKNCILVIVPLYKRAYIRNNDWCATPLQYSSEIKDLEFQVLLHGYKILENTLSESGLKHGLLIKKYKLKQIS